MVGPRDRPINDYALIGDCRSAALVSDTGSIDWLCWPRFDSPSVFGALLDRDRGGHFHIRPAGEFRSTRRYIGGTNVLETTFHAPQGVARLTDLMPAEAESAKRGRMWAAHQLLRRIEGIEGEVEIEIECAPRPDYGRVAPRLRDRGALGLYHEHRGQALILRAEAPLARSDDHGTAHARIRLRPGERCRASIVWAAGEPAFIPPLGTEADYRIEATRRYWERWASLCTYDGPYRDAVLRSALALKLMSYAPSGAVIAAPTTSLPEWPGGVRNWDYRYCWLRDASFTTQVLFDLGFPFEAEAFIGWMLHATRLSWPELQVLYDVHGETRLPESVLGHLAGYAESRPVRIGNDARSQLQLDIYGEVLDAVYAYVCRGGRLDRLAGRMLAGIGETVCRRWQEPDEGIWEIRGERRHHTYSKAMCWVALDRLLALEELGCVRVPQARYRRVRDEIRTAIEREGFDEAQGSYVSVFGSHELDASLLLLARYGYAPAHGARMRGTLAAIRRRLGRDGLLYRYLNDLDGLPAGEGAFGICSFWAAEVEALSGDLAAAHRTFERVLAHANDVGLFAEEVDPQTGAALGNFPQAFTHVGLIDAALTLECVRRGMTREHYAAARRGRRAQA